MDYQTELQEIGQQMAQEFQLKQQELQKYAASPNVTEAIIKIKQDELQKMYQRIQEYSQSIETQVYERQTELLKPFQTLLTNAINKVAKAEKFTYIFDSQSLASFTFGEDIASKVKAELNITNTPIK